MRIALAVVLGMHGLIHLLGFAKAFALAELPQLTGPIPRPLGLMWLAAALLVMAAAVAFAADARVLWWLAALAAAVSQVVIVTSWPDAKFGTIANVLLLLVALAALGGNGPGSLLREYERAAAEGLARSGESPLVAAGDLAALPPAVARYLRLAGVVGQPRVRNYRVHFRGRIRQDATRPWMPLQVEQTSFAGPPARLFFLRATLFGLPVIGLHRFVGPHATMRIQLFGLVPIVTASGPEMDRAETVTLFNDMCVLAPATLLSPAVVWSEGSSDTASASFTNAGQTIRAQLVFARSGELVDFVSDDRLTASADGRTFSPVRWTTPLRGYRAFGPLRLASHGDAVWHPLTGASTYLNLEILDVTCNLGTSSAR